MANLIFNEVPTEFIIIRNATKQLHKAEHLEAEDVDRLVFYVLKAKRHPAV